MSDTVIRVENLGKKYILKHQQEKRSRYVALRDVLAENSKAIGRKLFKPSEQKASHSATEEFWALKDVSFEVNRGDRVGIIGRNGAGKSTLLKVLSRITEPTTGRITLKGRVASLLEVGTGFHPELTGRENIFLNGAILGMSKVEIKKKFDEIVAFAEVEKFLDTPVKRYSSGMYVRLAFAVAAHLEPEILIVDEVLAVGDAAFQKKCLGKMEDVGKEGRTVLFVSHNMATVTQLCERSIWLERGEILIEGDTERVVSRYLSGGAGVSGELLWNPGIANPGVNEFKLRAVRIKNSSGEVVGILDARLSFWIEVEYEILKPLPYCRVGITLSTAEGVHILQTFDADIEEYSGLRQPGISSSVCQIPGYLLSPGRYTVSVNAGMKGFKKFIAIENALCFDLEDTGAVGSSMGGPRKGIIRPQLKWQSKVLC